MKNHEKQDAYDRGEKNRQAVLDLLNERGPLALTEIATLTGASVATVHKRIGRMVDLRELTSDGKPRPKYSAAVETTQSAGIDRAAQAAGFAAHMEARGKRFAKQAGSATKVRGNVITHVCSDHLPTPPGYGGGQARSRPSCSSIITTL